MIGDGLLRGDDALAAKAGFGCGFVARAAFVNGVAHFAAMLTRLRFARLPSRCEADIDLVGFYGANGSAIAQVAPPVDLRRCRAA